MRSDLDLGEFLKISFMAMAGGDGIVLGQTGGGIFHLGLSLSALTMATSSILTSSNSASTGWPDTLGPHR